jgi:hypothetical protein
MRPTPSRVFWGAALVFALAAGCRTPKPDLSTVETPSTADLRPTHIDYADADAFDALFETALVSQDPVIFIQTDHRKPDWGPRLNAWIAAWNLGSRPNETKARGQVPVVPKVTVDADSIRELRLLIDDLMGRVEDSARAGVTWWAETRMRNRRVALLKPYNLRFHVGDDGRIQLVFFHGDYAAKYEDFVRSLEGAGDGPWVRTYQCSHCRPVRGQGNGAKAPNVGE